jgi:hypothetical protein
MTRKPQQSDLGKSLSFTDEDGSRITVTVESDGLFIHCENSDYRVTPVLESNAGNEAWVRAERGGAKVRPTRSYQKSG